MSPTVDECADGGDGRLMNRRSHSRPALLFVLLGVFFASFFLSDDAHAYAWMIRHDYTACSTCHADPSGGELLTKYGRVTSDLVLRMHYGSDDAEGGEGESEGSESESSEPEGPDAGVFWGALDLPNSLLLSGAYRNLYVIKPAGDDPFVFVPVMQADLYGQVRVSRTTFGGSLGMAKVGAGSQHARPAQVTTGGDDQINLISRTHYVGVDIGDKYVLRGGRLNLPFGVRIPEHTAWVREATRTDRESDQQHGLALAYVGENLRAEVMAIAGNYQTKLDPQAPYADLSADAVRERGYSMYLEGIAGTSFAAGFSSKVTYARLDRVTFEEKTLRQAHGLNLRWAPYKRLSFLGEMDALFRTNTNAGYAGFLQGDYEPIQGLHFMLTGELLDEGLSVPAQGEPTPIAEAGIGQPKGGGWFSVDWFFYRQLEFRTDVVIRQNEPVSIWGQFHMYL